MAFITKQAQANTPFFVWMNFTRMHIFTHVRPEYRGKSGMPGNEYADGMWELDQNVGKFLKALDDLKIADNTIVVFTTDNGPNAFTWPDAATTPFRSEKDTNWEGAFRVPALVRWPGHIKAGEVANGIVSGLDWFPTLLAAAGDPTVKERLLKGWQPQGQPDHVPQPPGRLQPARLPDRQERQERPERVLLLQRRRSPGGHADGRLEARVRAAGPAGPVRRVGQSLQAAAGAQDVQPPHGSLRARRDLRQRLRPSGGSENAYLRTGGDEGRGVPPDLRRIPAQPAARQLQRRRHPPGGGQEDRRVVQEARAWSRRSFVGAGRYGALAGPCARGSAGDG